MTSRRWIQKVRNYKWTDRGMVVHSSEGEDLNAIDPGVFCAPDGTLWICYGSYHGNIELVELDPKTGLRIATNRWSRSSPATARLPISLPRRAVTTARESWKLLPGQKQHLQHPRLVVPKSYRAISGPSWRRHGAKMAEHFSSQPQEINWPGHFGRFIDDAWKNSVATTKLIWKKAGAPCSTSGRCSGPPTAGRCPVKCPQRNLSNTSQWTGTVLQSPTNTTSPCRLPGISSR